MNKSETRSQVLKNDSWNQTQPATSVAGLLYNSQAASRAPNTDRESALPSRASHFAAVEKARIDQLELWTTRGENAASVSMETVRHVEFLLRDQREKIAPRPPPGGRWALVIDLK